MVPQLMVTEILSPQPSMAQTPRPRVTSSLGGVGSTGDRFTGVGPEKLVVDVPGYQIQDTLGFGGMGTVFLARQASLDRPVALKVMSKRWSQDPIFVARFTREAYAAAQLNHPNVVQIYDIGDVEGHRYFSMEYVAGKSLAELIRTGGKLDPETAVGYVLQAARGLGHAHERGMIHRDVKPDNLLLNDQGIVKVADLGLVKTPLMQREADHLSTENSGLHTLPPDMTGARMALGTPAYMAPEQCRDAASVDHRADIYSLGCTLYAMLTGQQPFQGSTAVKLMTQHAYEPMVPPDQVVSRIPRELSQIVCKMMEKDPEFRYQTMPDVVRTLEQWLGILHAGRFSPRDDQIDALERQVYAFQNAPTALLKQRLLTMALSGVLLVAVLFMFFARLGLAFGLAAMVLQTSLAYFIVDGVARKTYLFRRVRHFISGSTAWDYLLAAAGLGLLALTLWMNSLFFLVVGFGFIATAVAIAVRVGLDRAIDDERREPLLQSHKLLRRMRMNGIDEEELRLFVAKYSGRHWEEFFEALFGFEAKLSIRALLLRGGSAGVREKFGAWREPLVNILDQIDLSRREAAERATLRGLEEARWLAAGDAPRDALSKADHAVEKLLEHAEAVRRGDPRLEGMDPSRQTAQLMPGLKPLKTIPFPPPAKRDRASQVINILIGAHIRAAIACTLFVGCLMWVEQNWQTLDGQTDALLLPGLPGEWTEWCDSVNVGWAGVLLFASCFFRGERTAVLALLGAGICTIGHHHGIRTVEPFQNYHVSLILGSILSLIAFRLGNRG
ncbi:MAG: serine/threonine-protein kinase [Fimbriiglobus sp.]